MKSFKNKNIIVTGGNAGIGLQAVKMFLEQGANVAIFDLDDTLTTELTSAKNKVSYFQCDVKEHKKVTECFKKAINSLKRIDILVNNAGILGPRIKTEQYSNEDFDQVIDINIKGVFYCMKEAISHFKEVGGGVIVNTASVAGKLGMARHIAYSASKHAVLGMTKSAAIECAKSHIRINAVCPGFTDTAMLDSANNEPEFKEMLRFATPMKRFGKPEEIANAILFLASDESSFITGQGIVLDGGLSVQ